MQRARSIWKYLLLMAIAGAVAVGLACGGETQTVTVVETVLVDRPVTQIETKVETVVVEKQVQGETVRVVETVVVEKPVTRTERVIETVVVEKVVKGPRRYRATAVVLWGLSKFEAYQSPWLMVSTAKSPSIFLRLLE